MKVLGHIVGYWGGQLDLCRTNDLVWGLGCDVRLDCVMSFPAPVQRVCGQNGKESNGGVLEKCD